MARIDPAFPQFVIAHQRVTLLQEARRAVEHAAHAAVARCIPPPKKVPRLKLVWKGSKS
jgi:hypothetical protein